MSDNCPHINFEAQINVIRIKQNESDPDGAPVKRYTTDCRVWCAECKKPFVWLGFETGAHLNEPMVSIDGQEGRFPIAPAGEAVSELEGTPLGFTCRRTA